MAGIQLTPESTVIDDREISNLHDASLANINQLETYKLYPFLEVEQGSDWDDVIETIEDTQGATKYLADEETPDSGTVGKGFRTVISAKTFGNGFKLTRQQQVKYASLKDSAQKEKIMKIVDKALLDVLTDMKEFVDRTVNAHVSDAFTGNLISSIGEAVPVISASHVYSSGQTYSNRIDVNGTLNKSFDHTVLDHFAVAGSRIKNSNGKNVAYRPDTIVVPSGTTVAQAARTILGFSDFVPVTLGTTSVYQNGVTGYTLIEVDGLGYDAEGNDLAFRDTMYFVYSTQFNSKPVYKLNFPTTISSTMTELRNKTKLWDAYGDLAIGTQNIPNGLFGSKGTNVA